MFKYQGGNLGSFPFLPAFTTWDVVPAGESGIVVFRGVSWTFYASNGYSIQMTVFIDGVALPAVYLFASTSTGEAIAQAEFAARGTRIAVQLQTLSLTGDLEHRNLQAFYTPLRQWPQK